MAQKTRTRSPGSASIRFTTLATQRGTRDEATTTPTLISRRLVVSVRSSVHRRMNPERFAPAAAGSLATKISSFDQRVVELHVGARPSRPDGPRRGGAPRERNAPPRRLRQAHGITTACCRRSTAASVHRRPASCRLRGDDGGRSRDDRFDPVCILRHHLQPESIPTSLAISVYVGPWAPRMSKHSAPKRLEPVRSNPDQLDELVEIERSATAAANGTSGYRRNVR